MKFKIQIMTTKGLAFQGTVVAESAAVLANNLAKDHNIKKMSFTRIKGV